MSRNLVLGRPPSAIESDLAELQSELAAAGDGSWTGGLDPSLRDRQARFEFAHFWLFSLLAAPMVAAARALQLHPAIGFTAFNIACAILMAFYLSRRCGLDVALLFVCVLLWWIDKVHAEVFFVTTAAVGLLLLDERPIAALLALGLLAGQLPVFAGVLGGALVVAISRNVRSPAVWSGALASVAIAALYPLYYLAHLGRWSPLASLGNVDLFGWRLLLTPMIDLNLGIVWFAPAIALLSAAGAVARPRVCSRAVMSTAAIGAAGLLLIAAQTQNVNSGATPGPSRYGLWCLGLLAPLAANGAAAMSTPTRQLALRLAVLFTLVFSAIALHPGIVDQGALPRPSAVAAWVWTRMPALDNPPPEVFAERISHTDGQVPVPVATTGCEKVLLVGRNGDVWWPKWCNAAPVLSECGDTNVFCYWNSGTTTVAPRQAAFDKMAAPQRHLATTGGRELE